MELLVALGVSTIVALGLMTAYDLNRRMSSEVKEVAGLEDLRNLIRMKVDCTKYCAGLSEEYLAKVAPDFSISLSCNNKDARPKVTAMRTKFSGRVIGGPLFDYSDGWLCKRRRPNNCLNDCHPSDTLALPRGYLMPSTSSGAMDQMIKCWMGKPIGVDFALARLICSSPVHDVAQGCINVEQFDATEDVSFAIKGRDPCEDYTQLRARDVDLSGAVLSLDFIEDFQPTYYDTFTIVRSEKPIIGKFRNALKAVTAGLFKCKVRYLEKRVLVEKCKK